AAQPQAVVTPINRMLAIRPEGRYPGMKDVVTALEAVATTPTALPHGAAHPTTDAKPARSRGPIIAPAISCLGALAAPGLGFFVFRGHGATDVTAVPSATTVARTASQPTPPARFTAPTAAPTGVGSASSTAGSTPAISPTVAAITAPSAPLLAYLDGHVTL